MYPKRWQQKLFQLRAWLRYWLEAVDGHSLHAPFVFQLYQQVVKAQYQEAVAIEALRSRLLASKDRLEMLELGAGSSVSKNNTRTLSSIARYSLTPARFSCFLYRLVLYTKSQNILELGTSLGINTLYLAMAAPGGKVYTLEGCPKTASQAAEHFKQMAAHCIHLHNGNIDDLLPQLLGNEIQSLDLAYLDANHTREATLRYFSWLLPYLHEDSVVVVDDIHWSADMQQAWEELCQHDSVSLSLDLYEAGLLFFRKGLQKQHYVVEF